MHAYYSARSAVAMLKRPSAADTEEDLLAFQQSFLASGSKPAASVAARSRVGEKRKQLQQGEHSREGERDVVRLQSEGIIVVCLWVVHVKNRVVECLV